MSQFQHCNYLLAKIKKPLKFWRACKNSPPFHPWLENAPLLVESSCQGGWWQAFAHPLYQAKCLQYTGRVVIMWYQKFPKHSCLHGTHMEICEISKLLSQMATYFLISYLQDMIKIEEIISYNPSHIIYKNIQGG